MSIFSKIWSAGERLLADDLNDNFDSLIKRSYTASGEILKNDSVYISANDTVKKIYPSAQETGASISTNLSHSSGCNKTLPLSTNGLYINLNGGDRGSSGADLLYAQVRTMNAGETDFSNGTEATIYSTGNGVQVFDFKEIGTDKFMVIFQANTGGGGAGVKVCVLTVSGTTITVGSITTIETTGSLSNDVAVAKVDTDKAIIFYSQDSSQDLYSQVLTVSGTTITTNTPVLVKAGGNAWHIKSIQLATNSLLVIYTGNTSSNLFGAVVTVSGTTPTIGTEQTLRATSADYYLGLEFISSTKALLVFSEQTTPTNDQVAILTISGSTVTKGTDLAIGSARITYEFGIKIITKNYALVANYSTNTNIVLRFLDISGSTPTSISTQNLTSGDTSGRHNVTTICKVKPWIYMVSGGVVADADYIVKLTPISTLKIGIAENDIADTVAGNIIRRFCLSDNFTGLTFGSTYYIDDDAQPTLKGSSVSPVYGYSINSTKMELQ